MRNHKRERAAAAALRRMVLGALARLAHARRAAAGRVLLAAARRISHPPLLPRARPAARVLQAAARRVVDGAEARAREKAWGEADAEAARTAVSPPLLKPEARDPEPRDSKLETPKPQADAV